MKSELQTAHGPVSIRPVVEADVAAFRDLRLGALQAHPEAFESDYESNLAQPPEFWQERVRRNTGSDMSIIYVASTGEALVGMTGIYRPESVKARHSALIWGVYVRPVWRGQGVADALMMACLDWARQNGVRIVKLGVATNNIAAIRRYLRCGFTVYGVEPEVIQWQGVYYDELLMIRKL